MITCKGQTWVSHACDLQLSHSVMNVAGQGYTSLSMRFKPMLHGLKSWICPRMKHILQGEEYIHFYQ